MLHLETDPADDLRYSFVLDVVDAHAAVPRRFAIGGDPVVELFTAACTGVKSSPS